jgi:exonuclease III
VRLLSWNVARRLEKLAAQAQAVTAAGPDVVALQEISPSSAPRWMEALAAAGLEHTALSGERGKRHRVLVASRTPLEAADAVQAPWPEAVVSVDVGGIRLHAAHVPNAANGWVKVRTLQALRAAVEAERGPRVVCGDLNTPRRENPLVAFARDRYGRLRPERGEEWDEAEAALLDGRAGLVDAFRALHPDAEEISGGWQRWPGGYRLDHVLVSPGIEVLDCRFHHDWRLGGLRDHSAIEAELRA